MADISFVEGQRDTLNSHINVLKNNCSITLENKNDSNFEIDNSMCIAKECDDCTVSSLDVPLHSMECRGNTENINAEIKHTILSPCDVNNLEPIGSCITFQKISQVQEASIELLDKSDIAESMEASNEFCQANSDFIGKALAVSDESALESSGSIADMPALEVSNECAQGNSKNITDVSEALDECSKDPDSITEVCLLEDSNESAQEQLHTIEAVLETSDECVLEKSDGIVISKKITQENSDSVAEDVKTSNESSQEKLDIKVIEASDECADVGKPYGITEVNEASSECAQEKPDSIEILEDSNICAQEKPDIEADVMEVSNECAQDKHESIAEVKEASNESDSIAQPIIEISLHDDSNGLSVTEQESSSLDFINAVDTVHNISDQTSEPTSGDLCSEVKDIDFYDSTGDHLGDIKSNSSHSSCLSNHVEDLDTYSKYNEAVACLSVDESLMEDSLIEEPTNSDDVQEPLSSSEGDLYIDETDNQENRVCANLGGEEMEMSEIKIGESLSITDNDYVNDLKDEHVLNGDCGGKVDESVPSVVSVISCANAVSDINCPNADITDASPNSESAVSSRLTTDVDSSKSTHDVNSLIPKIGSPNVRSGMDSSDAACGFASSNTTNGVTSPVNVISVASPKIVDNRVDELVISDCELEDKKDTDLDLVILESASVVDKDKEENSLTVSPKDNVAKDSRMTESKSSEDNCKAEKQHSLNKDIVNSSKTDLAKDKMLDDSPAKKMDDEHNKEASSNSHDLLKPSIDTDEAMDMDDDIVLLDDFDTPHTSPNTSSKSESFSFKNTHNNPDIGIMEEKSRPIVSDDHNKTMEITSEGKDCDSKVVDLAKTEDNSKNENRKRYSVEEFSSSASKRVKTGVNLSDVKDKVDLHSSSFESTGAAESQKVTHREAEKKEESPLTFQTTSEVLQAFITVHFKTLMKNQKLVNTEKLNRKTRIMQSTTNLWKETAKHLEKSVLDLTMMTKKLDKRKAHAGALKNMTSKSIGIQVHMLETQAKPTASQAPNPSTNKRVESTPVGMFNPSSLATQTQNQQSRIQIPANTSTVNQVASKNVAKNLPTVTKNSPNVPQNVSTAQKKIVVQSPAPSAQKTTPSPRQTSVPNNRVQQQSAKAPLPSQRNGAMNSTLIDLTDEEDISRTKKATQQPGQITPVSKPAVNNKPLTSPSNGYTIPIPAGTSAILMAPNQVALSQVQNSQILSGQSGSGTQFQMIPLNNNAQSSKTPILALLSGPRPPVNISAQNTTSPRILPSVATTPSTNTNPMVTKSTTIALPQSFLISSKHPAPLPPNQDAGNAPPTAKSRPPKPGLKISRVSQGIVLSWNMPSLENVERIASYQLFAYQENDNSVPKSSLWKKVGDVKALPLPMACTLTQFQEGNRYHFSVRAVDHYGRCGQYSEPSSIFLGPKT